MKNYGLINKPKILSKLILSFLLSFLILWACVPKENKQTPETILETEQPENQAIQSIPVAGEWWLKRHQEILKKKASNPELILVGNSIFHTLDNKDRKEVWRQYLDGYQTVNMGISGDRTENVIWRIENGTLDSINPKLAVLLIGTNNTDGNHYLNISTPEELEEGIWKICTLINEKLPETKILIMGILPYGYKPNHRDNINKATNLLISKFPEKNPLINYVDIGNIYLDENGKVKQELMPDYLHPNAEGHLLMFEALKPEIDRLINENN
ncbi:GDSL-type esterase/lipase family protein [Flexithrix dorotheae]|uniref:GDSL-type esterase/lipase family protein n=1 Tax=Flexithrix dorotheae TaxID=70993 RepID=UPI00037F2ECD|nr:GDSL-type esterase/lipase family protein [Flexithrix dorotheae]